MEIPRPPYSKIWGVAAAHQPPELTPMTMLADCMTFTAIALGCQWHQLTRWSGTAGESSATSLARE